jgi:hypothetical protein
MVDEISELKPKIVNDLNEKGFNVIDMKNGPFDLYIDMNQFKGCFIELKLVSSHYKAWSEKRGLKGLNLSSQTQEIRKMKNIPIVFACDEDDIDACYLILPDELRRLADEREEHDAILIGSKHLEKKSYEVALNKLVIYLNQIQQ